MSGFENLKVWQRSVDLAVSIYEMTKTNECFVKDFGLREQMRRASVSISSNISEGDEYGSVRQSVKFFYIAKGSVSELFTQLTIAFRIGYISEDQKIYYLNECQAIIAMLTNLIKARNDISGT